MRCGWRREPHESRAALPQGSQAGNCARRYASTCSQQPEEHNIVCIPQRAQAWTSMLKSKTAPPACMHGTTSHMVRGPAHRELQERSASSWGNRMATSLPYAPATGGSMRSLCGPAPKRLSVRLDPVKTFSADFNHRCSMRKPTNDVAATPEGPIAAQRK